MRIARAAGLPLHIAAKVPSGERGYFKEELAPKIDGHHVRLTGEVDDTTKQTFLAGAAALLFPIDWPEPFGLVMIEAMACGTPVIAYRCGSVPEVIDDGRHRLRRRRRGAGNRGDRAPRPARPSPGPRPLRAALHRQAHGGGIRHATTRQLARGTPRLATRNA
jgi:glycosyltransferase involved in cell wall biosynthesis